MSKNNKLLNKSDIVSSLLWILVIFIVILIINTLFAKVLNNKILEGIENIDNDNDNDEDNDNDNDCKCKFDTKTQEEEMKKKQDQEKKNQVKRSNVLTNFMSKFFP